jgi:hypothetical protein
MISMYYISDAFPTFTFTIKAKAVCAQRCKLRICERFKSKIMQYMGLREAKIHLTRVVFKQGTLQLCSSRYGNNRQSQMTHNLQT